MCTCLYNYKYVKMASYQSLCNGNELLNACRKGNWTLSEAFLCKICLRSATLSATVATCCGQLIGCHSCTDTWYTTNADIMKQTCPACRAKRGAAKLCQLRGKESLIKTGKEVLQDAEPTPDDSEVVNHASNLMNRNHDIHDLPEVNIYQTSSYSVCHGQSDMFTEQTNKVLRYFTR